MIVIKIEMWPGGDEGQKYELGTAIITNDGEGTASVGHYKYMIMGKQRLLRRGLGRLIGFPRARKNVWDLLRVMLIDREENLNPPA